MTQSYSVNEFAGHFKPAIEQSDWTLSQALNPCFSRCESPPVLPPPDFLSSGPPLSISNRPCFSAKTRSLFRQKMKQMKKENSVGTPAAVSIVTLHVL